MTPQSERLLHETESVCPVCLGRVPARYVAWADGTVWLQKECPRHGRFAVFAWPNAAGFAAWNRQNPAQPPTNPANLPQKGCPYDCGLCGNHRQATCCVLLEVTSRCNLGCPVCFASAGEDAGTDPPLATIEGWYDMLLRRGGPFNIQLSGGEPTLRDDLAEIIAMGRRKGFGFFQLNTNGLRLAADPAYLQGLVKAGLGTVFLQFDSLQSEATVCLRGRDVVEDKKQAIRNCAAAGVGVVLVPTIKRGCNDGELGALLRFAAAHMPAVRGVHFQPLSYFGRYGSVPGETERVGIAELLQNMEQQTSGDLKAAHFSPGGAEHPLCSFHADYIVQNGHWQHQRSSGNSGCCGAPKTSDAAREAVAVKWAAPPKVPKLRLGSGFDVSALDKFLHQKAAGSLAFSGMVFQDAWTLDLQRLCRCYIHVVSAAGELVPFCAYNLTAADGAPLHRRV